jgi:hypothetical protein
VLYALLLEPEERRLTNQLFPPRSGYPADVKIDLRDQPGAVGPLGTIAIVLPGTSGTLTIDARPMRVAPGSHFSVNLAAGTHRLEWFDSTAHRTVGETVDLLPFATRTVSFMRYSHERR